MGSRVASIKAKKSLAIAGVKHSLPWFAQWWGGAITACGLNQAAAVACCDVVPCRAI